MPDKQAELKRAAGERAAEYVQDGMRVGLGTGSTVDWTVRRIGEMVADGMRVVAVPTSLQTETLARECKIPLVDFSEIDALDIAIDGADEVDGSLDLIKGGGGALLREKLVAAAAKRFIVVADESKMVDRLGAFPLPVEVVPFAWETSERRIERLGVEPHRRLKDGRPFITDNGNFILDCRCGAIDDPADLHARLKSLVGVVETGLFIGMTEIAVIAAAEGVRFLAKAP